MFNAWRKRVREQRGLRRTPIKGDTCLRGVEPSRIGRLGEAAEKDIILSTRHPHHRIISLQWGCQPWKQASNTDVGHLRPIIRIPPTHVSGLLPKQLPKQLPHHLLRHACSSLDSATRRIALRRLRLTPLAKIYFNPGDGNRAPVLPRAFERRKSGSLNRSI